MSVHTLPHQQDQVRHLAGLCPHDAMRVRSLLQGKGSANTGSWIKAMPFPKNKVCGPYDLFSPGGRASSSGLAASESPQAERKSQLVSSQLGILIASSSSSPVGCCSSCLAVNIFVLAVGSVQKPFGSNGFQALPLVQNSNQECPTQVPLVPFIWACYVSSALQLVLICNHLLIFILLIDSLYSSLSEVHPNWSFPCFLSMVQCFFLFVLLMVQFGMMSSEQAEVCIPLLPPMCHRLKC